MFSKAAEDHEYLLFRAVVRMIETNSGIGFLNMDQSHPAYTLGANGKVDPVAGGDSPERNRLFQLLALFDPLLHKEVQDLSTWPKFCKFAVDACNAAHGRS